MTVKPSSICQSLLSNVWLYDSSLQQSAHYTEESGIWVVWHSQRRCWNLCEIYTGTRLATRTHAETSHTTVIHKWHQLKLWVKKLENSTYSFHSSYCKLAPPEEERLGEKRNPGTEWQMPFLGIHSVTELNNLIKSLLLQQRLIFFSWRRGQMKTSEHELDESCYLLYSQHLCPN